MSSTQDVVYAILPSRKLIRDAYIDVHGMPCTIAYNGLGTDRRDFFGDMDTERATYATTATINLVINLGKFTRLLDMFVNGSNEDLLTPLTAMCKLDDNINIGDRVTFDQKYYPSGTEHKKFQVIDVQVQHHIDPYSKHVVLNVLRDS